MLSIIITWRNRKELRESLKKLVETSEKVNGDLTIVNFGGSREMLRSQLGIYSSKVSVVQVEQQKYFNKSCAQNIGAFHTTKPVLFFCDCDIILDPECIQYLLQQVSQKNGIFATLAGVKESEKNSRRGKNIVCFGYELKLRTASGRELHIVDNEEDASDGSRQAPGLLMVRRSDFYSINGYNSQLLGWGWEDQDMIARLTLGSGLTRIQSGYAIHLSHDDSARVAHYPLQNRWESRDKMFRQALANYDEARFQGTYNKDKQRLVTHKISGAEF